MGERNIESLEDLPDASEPPAPVQELPPKVEEPPPVLVDVNYPEPISLSAVLRDVARWSGHAFVMEPAANTKIQIFAPRRLAMDDAYELFLASLSVVGLRAVQVGKVVKIVPINLVISA